MAAMRAGVRTLTALGERIINWNAISTPFISRRYLSSTPSLPPPHQSSLKSTAADDALLGGSIDSNLATPGIEVLPKSLLPCVVVYDGASHVCHGGVRWLINADKDKRIKFCCVQSKTAEDYLKLSGLKREDVLRHILFVEGLNLRYLGSAACLRVLSYLPLPYSALSAFMIIPSSWRDDLYDFLLWQGNELYGRDNDCIVLKEIELLERFIDGEELLARIYKGRL